MARTSGSLLLAALAALAIVTWIAGDRSLLAAPDAPAPKPAPAPDAKPAPRPEKPRVPPEPGSVACTRSRASSELRAKSARHNPTRGQIDAEFERCFRARIAACQLALDAEVDEGFACWQQAPWPEVPESISPKDIVTTSMCLLELKGVIADVRRCRTKSKKPADLEACVSPYISFTPECPLLRAERVWRTFPGREDIERAAKAEAERNAPRPLTAKEQAALEAKAAREAKLKAEQEARIAKETARCFGRTTGEFAEKLKSQPGPRSVPGCKYEVRGRVHSRNNVFVQLFDSTRSSIFLLRTRESFAEGELVLDRTGTFDAFEEAELIDGSTQSFAVFKLDPAPPKPAPPPATPPPAPSKPAPPKP